MPSIFKSPQARNMTNLLFGTGVSQLLPLLVSPILTRIYSPEDFGLFGFFLAASSLLAIPSSGQYELAILKPKSRRGSVNIAFLATILALAFAFLTLVVVALLNSHWLDQYEKFKSVRYFIPIGLLLIFSHNCLSYMLNRFNQFKRLSRIKIYQALLITATSLIFGFSAFNNGLLLSLLIGYSINVIWLVYLFHKLKGGLSFKSIRIYAKEYKSFPQVVAISNSVNTLANQTPVYFITSVFSAVTLGWFSLAHRVLIAPLGLISVSAGQVFFNELSRKVRNQESGVFRLVSKVAGALGGVSIIIFMPFVLAGSLIFQLLFGPLWEEAGNYAQIMSFGLMIRFIVSPLSMALVALSKEKILSLWQGVYFCSCLVLVYISRNNSIEDFLIYYMFNDIALYSIYLFVILYYSFRYDRRNR